MKTESSTRPHTDGRSRPFSLTDVVCDCVILCSKSRFPPDAEIPAQSSPRPSAQQPLGADLLWSASITDPESQRYSSGPGWPYTSRTIIFNETCLRSICMLDRLARQIRPSEVPPPPHSDLWFCFISCVCNAVCRPAISMFHLAGGSSAV